ncbi:IclR family transcriptional regulator [Sulfobacillus harzensis]|uniref:IclR family transcriptional regulator n=1 Tax=Sulfobacillus harzensis TaxID=2729629 RepID=A0A7Y0Q4W4_9FIRM|nr:IclR family transcriptional regulator [Sulfobacillus harzensis]NMP25037.1 IclR family transcriptional regulator [Sulfobacillus harzensis]
MAFSRNLQLVPIAVPHLDRLSSELGETVQMAILDGTDIVYIAKSESQRPVQLVSSVGSRLPAHATGLGKALLACLSAERLEELYGNTESLAVLSPNTIRTFDALRHDLQSIRARGYAIDAGECTPGLFCIATPILGVDHKALAAISVSVPESRFVEADRSKLASRLIKEAHSLSRKLGAVDPSCWSAG